MPCHVTLLGQQRISPEPRCGPGGARTFAPLWRSAGTESGTRRQASRLRSVRRAGNLALQLHARMCQFYWNVPLWVSACCLSAHASGARPCVGAPDEVEVLPRRFKG